MRVLVALPLLFACREHPFAPFVLWVQSGDAQLAEGEETEINALVSDPQGVENLAGGELSDASGTPIAVFERISDFRGQQLYTLTLSWDDIHAAEPISFTEYALRSFEGRFTDAAGFSDTGSFELALRCPDDEPACDGVCGRSCP